VKERFMFTVIRRYRLDDGDMDEVMHLVDSKFADPLSHEPGFIAYEAVRGGPDVLITISTFSDEAGCDRSTQLAADFVRDEMSHMKVTREDATSGQVAVSRAAREVLEPAHA
jgi:quinol monooxygenase YgiN